MINKTLCGYINYWSENRSNEVAIYEEDKEITYKQLAITVRSLQEFFLKNDVKGGDVVAIADTKTFMGVAQYLALFGIGVSAMPLSQEITSDKISKLLADVKVKGISINYNIINKYNNFNLNSCNFKNKFVWITNEEIKEFINMLSGNKQYDKFNFKFVDLIEYNDHFCYDSNEQKDVYYNVTSGSTGKPLVVSVGDNEIIKNSISVNSRYKLNHNDCYCSLFAADMHPHEIFARSIVSGSKMAIFNSNNIRSLENFIKDKKITQILATPIIYETLLGLIKDKNNLISVRHYLCGGEAVSYDLRDRFYSCIGKKLEPVWGSTETSGTAFYVPEDKLLDRKFILGIPLEGYEIKIQSDSNRLLIKGEACFNEYLNNKLVNVINDDGYYITSDVVSMEDGVIVYEGRSDSVIKFRGRKISLPYIEDELRQVEDIIDVCVVKLHESSVIGIAIVIKNNSIIKEVYNRILNTIGEGLQYRVYIVINIPRLSSGKVDRQKVINYMENEAKRDV